jgi:hypothetical protein
MFIDQPFTTGARLGTFHAINLKAFSGAVSSPALIAGSTLFMSKLLPGSMPIRPG